jgi:glycosyltransferase involved in cell wall biosynthesis
MSLSCIIPAYNEASRIGRVLAVVTSCPLINEVVVVDDCSLDATNEVVKQYPGVTLLIHSVNQGKSASVYDAIQKVTGDVLLFLDADLEHLTADNLEKIIMPVLKGNADVTISLRGNAPFVWKMIGIDYISGERCFRRSVLAGSLEQVKKLHGFALEVFLNDHIIKNKLRLAIVRWPNVRSPFKRKHFGIHLDFLIMGMTVLKEISVVRIVMQISQLKRLIVIK